jgi:hypothetical protein
MDHWVNNCGKGKGTYESSKYIDLLVYVFQRQSREFCAFDAIRLITCESRASSVVNTMHY